MGSITVVNLTNSPLQSAITNTGNIYSGVNGLGSLSWDEVGGQRGIELSAPRWPPTLLQHFRR